MASASKSTTLYSSNGSGYTLQASFTENGSPNVSNNTTNITCTAKLSSGNPNWSTSNNSTLTVYWHDNRENYDRKIASVSFAGLGANSSKTASASINVTHKDDGTLSGYAKAVFTKGSTTSVWAPASGNVSTNNTALTTIARASQPSLVGGNDFNIGDTITINTNRKSTSFTHTATFTFGSYSTQIGTGITNSIAFDTSTIANDMYQVIPNASVGTGTITLQTYNGSTSIGTKTLTVYAHVVNSDPTFSCAYEDFNSTTLAITNNNQQIIRNNSKLRINITNASAKNYATLSSANAEINGIEYTTTISGSTATLTVGELNLSSDTTAIVSVTDSRGITTSEELDLTILDWQLPSAIIDLQRQNNFYSTTDITVDADYSSLDSKNTISIKVREKKVTDSTYSAYTTLQDNVTSTFTLDNNYAWDVQVLLEDRLGSTTYNLSLDRGIPIAFFDRLKRSVGINCFPSDNGSFEVDDENILSRIAGYGENAKEVTGDWDSACGEASGIYLGTGLSNSPSGTTYNDYWLVLHLSNTSSYQRQIAFSFTNIEEMYIRVNNNGTWTDWESAGSNKWKLIDTKTGSTSVSLPSTFDELLCVVSVDNNANINIPIVIPYGMLTTTSLGFNGGYFRTSNVGSYARILATTTSANLTEAYLNGNNDKTSTSVTKFYYR